MQVQIRTEEELDRIVIDTQNVVLDAVQNPVTKLVFRKRRERRTKRNQGFVRILKKRSISLRRNVADPMNRVQRGNGTYGDTDGKQRKAHNFKLKMEDEDEDEDEDGVCNGKNEKKKGRQYHLFCV